MTKILILIATVFFFSQTIFAKTDLKLNLEDGKSYHQIMESTSTINQVGSAEKIDLLMSIRSAMTFTVTGINDDYYMDVNYDSLSMQMSMTGYTMSHSSESSNGKDDYISLLLSGLKNKTFKIIMSNKGEILNVSNLEIIFKNAFDKLSEIDSNVKAKLEFDMRNAFGSESFNKSFETITAIYPPEPVDLGREWVSKIDLNKNMPIRMNTIYKFKEETDDSYIIEGVGTIISLNGDEYNDNTSPSTYELTGTSASSIRIDKTTGWIKQATMKQDMSGYSIPKTQADPANPKKVEMEFKIVTTYND